MKVIKKKKPEETQLNPEEQEEFDNVIEALEYVHSIETRRKKLSRLTHKDRLKSTSELVSERTDKNGPFPARSKFTTNCWTWIGELEHGVKPVIDLTHPNSKRPFKLNVSRWLWEHQHGKRNLPNMDKDIFHACGNRSCVNPHHLQLGTPSQRAINTRDNNKLRPGGKPMKLNREMVQEIRKKVGDGEDMKILAAEYGVSDSYIRNLALKKSWKDVPDLPGTKPPPPLRPRQKKTPQPKKMETKPTLISPLTTQVTFTSFLGVIIYGNERILQN